MITAPARERTRDGALDTKSTPAPITVPDAPSTHVEDLTTDVTIAQARLKVRPMYSAATLGTWYSSCRFLVDERA